MDNFERKEKGSRNYGSRGVWGHRSSANRRPPVACQRSVPAWEKKFCESICLIPWHKLLEAKKFMHLYENVVSWNDTAAEEAFKNAKSRFWAEMNGLPCNIKLPDPDTYIDKVDWNSNVDPELLLDLEGVPDMDSNMTGGAESDIVFSGKPLMLDSKPFTCDEGWGNLDEVPVSVPPTRSAESQGWINWNEMDQCGGWDVQESLDRSKGWNNWDVDDGNNKYLSKCNWEESGYANSWNEDSYGNHKIASGSSDSWQGGRNQGYINEFAGNSYGGRGERKDENGWGRERVTHSSGWDHGHYSLSKNVGIDGVGRNHAPQNNYWRRKEGDDYWPNKGFKSSRGRKRQEQPRWADRNPSYGHW